MTITIDIGNSNIKLAIHEDNKWQHIWRFPSDRDKDIVFFKQVFQDQLAKHQISLEELNYITLSSVVPALTEKVMEVIELVFQQKPIRVEPAIYHKLPVKILNPEQMGTDLIANCVSVHLRYKKAAIIVDFGTALTFTTIDKKGEILGVAIAPGIKTAIAGLASKAAQLPEIPIAVPASALGTDTVSAIQAGILQGYVGLVNHLLDTIKQEVGSDYMCIATGGLAYALQPLKTTFDVIEQELTLNGIRLIGALAQES